MGEVSAYRLAVEPDPAGNRGNRDTLPMQFKDHDNLPKSDQRRAPPRKGPSSLIGADRLPGSAADGSGSAHLGKIQPAHLGSIQPALTRFARALGRAAPGPR